MKRHPEILKPDYRHSPERSAAEDECRAQAPKIYAERPGNARLSSALHDSELHSLTIISLQALRMMPAYTSCFEKKTGLRVSAHEDDVYMPAMDAIHVRYHLKMVSDVRKGQHANIDAALKYEQELYRAHDECRKPIYEFMLATYADSLHEMVTHPDASGVTAGKARWAGWLAERNEFVAQLSPA